MLNKHITQPDPKGFQVRIVRNKKEYSRYFSHNEWGGRTRALKGARNWRDQMLVTLGSTRKTLPDRTIAANKKTTGVRGVSRTIHYDKRRDARYLVYSVYWRDNGKPNCKSFQVGRVESVTADDEFHAFRTAVLFRHEYELSVAEDESFHPERFKSWRRERLYEVSRE